MAQAQATQDTPVEQAPKRSLLSLVKQSGAAINTHVSAFLGPNIKVIGDVSFNAGLRIDGAVKGDITSGSDASASLTIGGSGQIQGNIRVAHLIVYGQIQGNVFVTGLLDVRESALITGDVHYRTLEVAPGGTIQGRLIPNPST